MAHRTALIAAGSIAIMIVAATVAVGANLGILDAADSRPVGQLSASANVQTTGATLAEASAGNATDAVPQTYVIKKAGTVSVAATKTGLRLDDVTAKPGWRWTLTQTTDSRLTVTFRSHSLTYKFVAVLGRDRTIVARVDRPVTKVAPSASSATVVASTATPTTGSASSSPANDDGSDHGADGDGGAEDDD